LTAREFAGLTVGSVVESTRSGHRYVVTAVHAHRVRGELVVKVTDPSEWRKCRAERFGSVMTEAEMKSLAVGEMIRRHSGLTYTVRSVEDETVTAVLTVELTGPGGGWSLRRQ